MIKKITAILLMCFYILTLFTATVSADRYYYDQKWNVHNERVKLYYNDKQVFTDVPPLILNGRTLVPVRAFFERLDADVTWDSASQKVVVKKDDLTVTLYINKYEAYVNDRKIIMDVPAKIITDEDGVGRTLVPVRFISTQLGYKIDWDEKTYSVHLSDKTEVTVPEISKPPANDENNDENADVNNFDKITGFSANSSSVTIKTSKKGSPVISKIANPSRLVLDFYGFQISGGDGALSKSGKCFSGVRYANHADYARVVIDITEEYIYSVNSNASNCVVTLTPKNNTVDDEETDTINPSVDTMVGIDDNNEEHIGDEEDDDDIATPSKTGGTGLVVIDPGHGGSDPGAIGYKDGEEYIRESEINLDISQRLYDILEENGVEVSMTRYDDEYVGLTQRAEYANNLDATLFICVHNNSATIESANGSMVYYYTGESDEETKKIFGITSKELAALIQKPLLEYGGRYDRKIADGSRFVVLYSTQMPAVLIECAFVSNEEEQELLNTEQFRQALAEGIAEGVIEGLKKTGKY